MGFLFNVLYCIAQVLPVDTRPEVGIAAQVLQQPADGFRRREAVVVTLHVATTSTLRHAGSKRLQHFIPLKDQRFSAIYRATSDSGLHSLVFNSVMS